MAVDENADELLQTLNLRLAGAKQTLPRCA